ncbi:MAG: carboxypeptidase-like regulatory domain-containing protein, partial [Treponema sp.]|nr:carboxypeptidase-like regulatory domain-containing protein [Treponema sp.]
MARSRLAPFVLAFALALLPAAALFAGARADESREPETLRDEWILTVTRPDMSALPPSQRASGEAIHRRLFERLSEISFRLRLDPEMEFYESYEWRRAVQQSAQALARRQNDRALLLYRGDPDWRRRRDLARIDADIQSLREEFERRERERPAISLEPAFALKQSDIHDVFPAPPAPGGERRFALAQGADAFLSGEILEFHGRFFMRLRVFALYADAFVFEDDVIFSMDALEEAVDEIAGRLSSALSGAPPARVAVRAYPPEAQILFNGGFAGTGEARELARPPGALTVAVSAPGHAPLSVELDLAAGELADVEIVLGETPLAEVAISVPEGTEAGVHWNALFAGFAPLTLGLPIGGLAHISIEDSAGRIARAVVAAPEAPGAAFDYTFAPAFPPVGEGLVNSARKRFYWAWAGFWGAMTTWWIAAGL